MTRTLFALLSLTLVAPAFGADDELRAWVHAKIAAQKASQNPLPAGGQVSDGGLWRERPATAQKPIPSFVPPTSLAPLVRQVRPGVVNIAAQNEGSTSSLGSGFVITPDGLVVTNNHVVERAQQIQVRLNDGRAVDAELVGRDATTDLALLRLTGVSGLPTVILGDSDQLEVGDWVVAIGNPFGLDTSVTHGIISARERVLGVGPYDDFIQTNALINPGNSGGPLFDMRGDVVGVTTAIIAQGQGIGFAVPINLVKDLLPNLVENGTPEHGWLGVNVKELGEGPARGSVVIEVYEHSPAVEAGVHRGDRVVGLNGKPVTSYQQLLRRITLLAPGTTVKLSLVRDGQPLELSATLAERPQTELKPAPDALTATRARLIDRLGLVVSEGAGKGLAVEAVTPGAPAALAGLAVGDVVVEVNREPVGTFDALAQALSKTHSSEALLVRFRRGDALRFVTVKPATKAK